MFSEGRANSISGYRESDLIAHIQATLGGAAALPTPQGIGDDCALLEHAAHTDQIITTDSLSYRLHFDAHVSAHQAGAKLIKRNLSDIAAMGGQPGPALLNLLMGANLSTQWLEGFLEGARECCQQYSVNIVGGDISALPEGQFTAVLTQTGTLSHKPLLRSGTCIGDRIYVTGELGGSLLGKHHNFSPRLEAGAWLAQQGFVRGVMDITDGLAKDLRQILPKHAQAQISLDKIPVSQDAIATATNGQRTAIEHAFCDGEDYELLFAIPKEITASDFEADWQARLPELQLSMIGEIAEAQSAAPYINAQTKEDLPWQQGFEHLSEK